MYSASEQLINEVRLLYQSLVQMGEKIHKGSTISMGMRAVLEYLDRNGRTTVPQMAKARRVTRQRIQTLVNALLAEGLVEIQPNPASKRSPLVGLCESGAGKILQMREHEGRFLKVAISDTKLRDAAATLAVLRDTLEQGYGNLSDPNKE